MPCHSQKINALPRRHLDMSDEQIYRLSVAECIVHEHRELRNSPRGRIVAGELKYSAQSMSQPHSYCTASPIQSRRDWLTIRQYG